MAPMRFTTLPPPLATLTAVRLHASRDRADDPAVLAAVYADGQWHVGTGTREGRYYPVLVGEAPGGVEYEVMLDYADLPHDPTLVVSPEVLATDARMSLPLTADLRDQALSAIRNAQADVVAYLGRPITPITFVQQSVWPMGESWVPSLTAHGDDPVLRVISSTPEMAGGVATGYYTITYLAGLDGAMDPALDPIRRFVLVHAKNSPEFTEAWKVATNAKGATRTVTAEGQSMSYEKPTLGVTGGKPGDTAPGSLPTLASLDRWRLAGRRVHVADNRASMWPYGVMGGLS